MSINKKGFTLIELLIVVVILGVLIAIVIGATRGDKDKADDKAIQANAARIQTALEDCFDTDGGYPADQATMVTSGSCVDGKFDNGVPVTGVAYTSTDGTDYSIIYTTSAGAQPALTNKQ